jgi:hypothetical protein
MGFAEDYGAHEGRLGKHLLGALFSSIGTMKCAGKWGVYLVVLNRVTEY